MLPASVLTHSFVLLVPVWDLNDWRGDRIHFIKRLNLWLPVFDSKRSFNCSINHKHLLFPRVTWDKEIKRLRELETIFTHAGLLKVHNYENYRISQKKTFLWATFKGIESASNLCFGYALCFTLFNERCVHIITVIGNIFWQDFNCINIHYTYSAYAKYQSSQINVICMLRNSTCRKLEQIAR